MVSVTHLYACVLVWMNVTRKSQLFIIKLLHRQPSGRLRAQHKKKYKRNNSNNKCIIGINRAKSTDLLCKV